jgi:hypothetical protein
MVRLKYKILLSEVYLIVILYPGINYAQTDSTVVQKEKLAYVYLDFGAGISKKLIIGIGGDFVFSNNWGGSLSYAYYSPEAKELPADYTGSFFGNPTDNITTYSVRLIREFPIYTKLIRLGIEGGVSLIEYQKAHFAPNPNPGWFGSNYIVTHSNENTAGLSFKGKAEFPLSRFLGCEIALISNVNEYQSYVGAELHFTLGLVRDRMKPLKKAMK